MPATSAAPPYQSCTRASDADPARTGVSAIPIPVPTRLARVTRPTAVARWERGNQCPDSVVQALSRNGCATAAPIVASSATA